MPGILWARHDQLGHDACRITETPGGWIIEGAAVFAEDGQPAHLSYRLICGGDWASVGASVTGWVGGRDIRLTIEREGAGWLVNGAVDAALNGLLDIDLGFTPASNTNAIRRLGLSDGGTADAVAVWLDTADWTVRPLPQTYRRIHAGAYHYASPRHGYAAILTVDDFGIVTDYPDLWAAVSMTGHRGRPA